MGRRSQSESAGSGKFRPLWTPHRRGAIPSRLSRIDAPRPRCGVRGVGMVARRERACASRGNPVPDRAGRFRHQLPDDDDLCRCACAARRGRCRRGMAAAYSCKPLRSSLPPAGGKSGRHDRHGDDGKAGRQRRAGQHHARRPCRRGGVVQPHRPQMVLQRADVRCIPDARLCRGRPDLLPRAEMASGSCA